MTANTEKTILVCCGIGCIVSGARKVLAAMEEEVSKLGADIKVKPLIKETGCHGFCEMSPMVRIMPDDIVYMRVQPADAAEIVISIANDSSPVERLLWHNDDGTTVKKQKEIPFYKLQQKLATANVGLIDPHDIDDYINAGGYSALVKALEMTQDEIICEVEKSGIRGRGGAGFATGRKWRTAYGYDNFPKYVVCNGDEGDPGAFMDCAQLEGDPHSVVEGLAIAAIAIGAEEGVLYIRDEYVHAVEKIKKAIADAKSRGFLGDNILGKGKNINLSVVRGGGAFVCGESTAMMASIEGRVGEPRAKYIRSVQRGLWNQPTVLNNVETLANIPRIIREGGEKFAQIGTKGSTGTKVFSVVGNVKYTGIVEVPMGITLRQLIFDICGGMPEGRKFKAVQTGGPSGGCIPESLLDLPVDYDSLSDSGSMMGSGGVIVIDDHTCMVEIARYYVEFLCEESCGKCTPCREGLRQMLHILTDICEGRGREGDVELLENICNMMLDSALCGLGKAAPNPVLTTIKFFKDEFDAHIKQGICPAGSCRMSGKEAAK